MTNGDKIKLRAELAGKAMQGILSGVMQSKESMQAAHDVAIELGYQHYSQMLAVTSLKYADALMAELGIKSDD